jgi:hypothetical protein
MNWLQKEESTSFLKKRSKKLLTVRAERPRPRGSQNDQTFFAAFFSKKQALLPLAFASRRLPGQSQKTFNCPEA